MAKAHYTVHVPNTARQVGIAAHHYLTSGTIRGIHHATLSYGHPDDALEVIGEETPELDSHIKQTATFVGDVANAPAINVTKRGKSLAHWTLANPHYQPVPTAPPAAFAPPVEQPLGHPAVQTSPSPV